MNMKTFKKFHHYKMKKIIQKTSSYIKEIMPIEDRKVPESMFNLYDDITELKAQGKYDERKY